MWRTDSFEKTLMLGKIEGRRRRARQRTRWLYGITDSMDMSLSYIRELWWTGRPGELQSMGSQRVRHDWTEVNQCSGFEKLSGSCLSFGWRKGSIKKGIKDQPYRYIKKTVFIPKRGSFAIFCSLQFILFCFQREWQTTEKKTNLSLPTFQTRQL